MIADPMMLARLHARCFQRPRPWSEAEFTALLADPSVFLCENGQGFALGRSVLDEAELLTLAVDPDQRRKGAGTTLLRDYHHHAIERGARTAFLEVAADNDAAIALYLAAGYKAQGRRPGYYRAPGTAPVDALILQRRLG